MLVIENCNSLSELRQKLIDGEEVRTVRQKSCKDAISKTEVIKAIDEREDANGKVDAESIRTDIVLMSSVKTQEPCEDVIRREDAINAVSEALEHVVVEHEDVARKMMNKLSSVNPQEPCDDTISRQAVLDLIEHYNSDGLGSVFYGYEEGVKFADKVNKLPPVTPQPKTGYISIDDVMSVFDDFMCGEVDEDGTDTFLKMLKDKAESEE